MLEKLATHDVQDIADLFSLADKCARVAKGRTWHSPPALEAGKVGKPKPLASALIAAAEAMGGGRRPCGDKHPRQASGSDNGGTRCLVHNYRHHSAEECREIKKLTNNYVSR
jgi:hypothetical protein